MLVDANILNYAADRQSPDHRRAAAWLTDQINGDGRIALPWSSLTAFLRITTHPRASSRPLAPAEAWSFIEDWLAAEAVWIPAPTDRHADVLGSLIAKYRPSGNLVPDTDLAALAIEHGLAICSADTDFARFSEVRWHNPLAG